MTTTLAPEIWQALHENRKSLTAIQQRALLKATEQVDDSSRALCLVLYYTGCRLSEALNLRRKHICNARSFVAFRTLKRREHAQWRAVPIPADLVALLLSLVTTDEQRVFDFSRWTAARRLKPIFERAGIVGLQANSRSLRHSYQDRVVELPTRAAAALLGHTPRVNHRHYGDLIGYELTELVQSTWDLTCTIQPEQF